MKTTVSQLKRVSARTCILLPNVMVSFPFKTKGYYLEYYNKKAAKHINCKCIPVQALHLLSLFFLLHFKVKKKINK